jgi:ribonuclease HI
MEMMGALIALERLKYPCNVILHSDSQYLKNGMTLWMKGWKRNGWITSEKKPVKNVDLWKRLDLAASRHNVRWKWVKVMPVIERTKCVTVWLRSPPTPQLICLTSVTLIFVTK